jgi:hypothetical protein
MAQAGIDGPVGKMLPKDDTPTGEFKDYLRKLRISDIGGDG